MSKAFDNLIKKVKDKSPTLVGDVKTSAKIIWADVPSPQVTYMMGGGIPTGRIIRFRGPSSAGKSAFCNYIASCLQKECPKLYNNPNKNKVIYLDYERTFEIRFASSVGIDTSDDKFYHLKPRSIEEAADILAELVETGEVAAIIFDSDAAAPTAASMVDEFGKASFGGQARAISEFLRKFNILCADTGTTILWISQERANMKPMARLPQATGGEALPFYCSIICRVTKKDDIKGNGDEGIIGIEMCVRNYKNKCSTPFRMADGLKLYYDGGFDPDSEYIDFLLKFGYMELKGSYFKFNYEGQDYSIQGRTKLLEWLHGHQDIYDIWQKEIKTKLSGYCEELDANNIAVNEETGKVLNEKDAKADAEYLLRTTGGGGTVSELAEAALAAAEEPIGEE